MFSNKKKALASAYSSGNATITTCARVQYLGITLATIFIWEPHIQNICSATLQKLFLKAKQRNAPPALKRNA